VTINHPLLQNDFYEKAYTNLYPITNPFDIVETSALY